MKIKILAIFVLLIGVVAFSSCSDNDETSVTTEVTVQLNDPVGITSATYTNMEVTLENRSSGQKNEIKDLSGNTLNITVTNGAYNITITGDISYTVDGVTKASKVRAYKESIAVSGDALTVSFDLFIYESDKSDFVIKEIFYTGSLTPEGKQTFDQYFIIYNNSDETLYADGLFLAESAFLTTKKEDYKPNIVDEAFTVGSLIMVPGSGKDYPIAPKTSFVIANDAVNHKELNPNAIDLSKADFENIYPVESGMTDVDNPDVPNMLNIVDKLVIHNRGYKSYVIGRLGVDKVKYLADYQYEYSWVYKFNEYVFDMEDKAYKLPNEWIIDAVNLSIESEFQWIVTSSSLDMGWTYCGKVEKDPTRYGKSVQRKVAGKTPDGKDILLDTNNSKHDFNPEVEASLKDK